MNEHIMNANISGNTVNWDGSSLTGTTSDMFKNDINNCSTTWGLWSNWYYPNVIRESYPVYLQEKAVDKGKQAFEIIKALQDKRLLHMEKVSDFIEAMDTVLKTL